MSVRKTDRKQLHKLVSVDPASQTGECRTCGPDVPLVWRRRTNRAYWECRVGRRASRGKRGGSINPVTTRRYHLKKKFGITPAEYDALLASQNGGCAICGQQCPTNRNLAVDHDHETGRIRGLLCNPCNRAVGLLRDDPDLLAKAAQYLLHHQ